MTIWNAFYKNFIHAGAAPRAIALGILVGFLLLRKFGILEKCRGFFSKSSPAKWLFFVLILGFTLRLLWVGWSPYSPPSAGTEDGVMVRHAQELISGRGYVTVEGAPSAERPIGYALVLAAIFKVFGESIDLVAFMNIFFNLLTLWLVYRLGVAAKNEFVGILAALLLALYPTSIIASRMILEEHLFLPMWLGGILLLIADYQKPSWIKVLWAALLFAVAAHFRTFSFAMGLVAFFMWFFYKREYKQAFLRLLLIQTIILLVALPWAIRNQKEMGEPVFFSTSVGLAMYYSNNPISDNRNPTLEEGGDVAFITAKNEVDRNRAGKKAAMEWITHNPGAFFQRAISKVIYLVGLTREGWVVKDNFYTLRAGRTRPPDKVISKINRAENDFYGVVFLLSFFGLAVFFFSKGSSMQKCAMTTMLLTLFYYLSMIAITLGYRKYRFPLEPFFCIFAAYGISFFTDVSRRQDQTISTTPISK